ILAVYARGNDSGGRCLRSGPAAALAGDAVTLDLQWEAGTCGAPATAHYPFALVSLSRALDDGGAWIQAGRTVGAAPPGATPRDRASPPAPRPRCSAPASPRSSPPRRAAPAPAPSGPSRAPPPRAQAARTPSNRGPS